MRLAIMQPYFFPYIGYFQLISSADLFVIYSNIKYTKKGWINRNRLLQSGHDTYITLPLKSDSDFLNIEARQLAPDFSRKKLLNQIRSAYLKAPNFDETFSLLEKIIAYDDNNLFRYLRQSIVKTCEHLAIPTKIIDSNSVDIDHSLKSQEKVIAISRATNARVYINAIGGTALYSKDVFQAQGVELKFIDPTIESYPQFCQPFVPALSIIDVMMFNSREAVKQMLKKYTLV